MAAVQVFGNDAHIRKAQEAVGWRLTLCPAAEAAAHLGTNSQVQSTPKAMPDKGPVWS